MGIKDFTKVFPPQKEITYKELSGTKICIDASAEIYRAFLGMSSIAALTDINGKSTVHINTILLGVILLLKKHNIDQYWVFDHFSEGDEYHIELKTEELKKRADRRNSSKARLELLQKQKKALENEELFSSDDEESEQQIKPKLSLEECKTKIISHEKQLFQLDSESVLDIMFMLNCLDIPWVTAPAGFEAEQICAFATRSPAVFGTLMDYVLTPDADAIVFGAKNVIKRYHCRSKKIKKLYLYNLDVLLNTSKITHEELIDISLMLGSDMAEKTKGVGPKTVLKKFKNIVLTETQQKAKQLFMTMPNTEFTASTAEKSFSKNEKFQSLLTWLEVEKNFKRDRIITQFQKAKLFTDL